MKNSTFSNAIVLRRLIWLLFAAVVTLPGFAQKKEVSIGIVNTCPDQEWIRFAEKILEEAQVLVKSEFNLVLNQENIRIADCDPSKVKGQLDDLLSDQSVDIILSMDAVSSHVASRNGPYKKPVIAVTVINAQLQKIPLRPNGTSGVDNLTYLELPYSPIRDLEVFDKLVGFNKIAIIEDKNLYNAVPEMKDLLKSQTERFEAEFEFVFAEKTAQATLNKIDDSFDAVYLLPSENLSDEEYQKLIEGINERNIKSFSILGRTDVERGVLGGVAPSSNLEQVIRRIALNLQRSLNGENPSNINVKIFQKEEFVLNMETARKIDFSPSWEALAEAVLINEERDDIDRTISLFDAIAEGLEENLNLEVGRKQVEVLEEDANIAKSFLLPDVTASVSHRTLDETTADAGLGLTPENRGLSSVQLTQVIYSEQAVANNKIASLLLEAQKEALSAQSLDVVLRTSIAYLNIMQAKAVEVIRKQNLELTRKNLELARVSSSLGQSGPSDLYRWKGEIAVAKANLLRASANRRRAEIFLSQILNRPVDEEFNTEEVDISDVRIIINNESISQLITNPRTFYQLADFQVERAKQISPDLKQVDYNLAAQERSVQFNNRNRFIPTISLGANYNYELYRGGAGQDPLDLSAIAPGLPATEINDTNWAIQVGASLPLFQGNRRSAQYQQAKVQKMQLDTQRENQERIIEQQIRSELENVRASFRNITLTKEAEKAVVQNFEIVQDAYSEGFVTITQLLDAQNATISAQLNSANAVYDFLIDLLNMERASGSFYMLMTEEEKANYINKLSSYITN